MSRKSTDLKALRAKLAAQPRPVRIAVKVLAVTLLVAVIGLPLAMAEVDRKDTDLRRLRSETGMVLGLTAQAQRDHDFIVENKDRYENALARKLLEPQDRLEAQQILDELVDLHHLVRLTHELAPVRLEPPQGGSSGPRYEAVITPVSLEVGAMLDRDVFEVLDHARTLLPGVTVLRGMRLTRERPVTDAALERLRAGVPAAFIAATIDLEWRSARPVGEGR